MPGVSAVPIVLSEGERAELVRRAGGPGVWRADRARIVLACAGGMSNAAAARALGVAVKSVSKWRRQFAAQRLAGLEDAAPVGRRKAELVLTEAERAQLAAWARRAKTAQFLGCGRRSCCAVPTAGRTGRPPPIWGWMNRRWSGGGPGSSPAAWTAWPMSRGRGGRRRSCWTRSRM